MENKYNQIDILVFVVIIFPGIMLLRDCIIVLSLNYFVISCRFTLNLRKIFS